ncbi:MAG: hypothetical protein KDK54_22375 [Leptospiraceae bacterium]|nr:hypothetical protein [Leptospiraceae bacterium]
MKRLILITFTILHFLNGCIIEDLCFINKDCDDKCRPLGHYCINDICKLLPQICQLPPPPPFEFTHPKIQNVDVKINKESVIISFDTKEKSTSTIEIYNGKNELMTDLFSIPIESEDKIHYRFEKTLKPGWYKYQILSKGEQLFTKYSLRIPEDTYDGGFEIFLENPQITYQKTNAYYLINKEIEENKPIIPDWIQIEQFHIYPRLPLGLQINPLTGIISGIPSEISPLTKYRVFINSYQFPKQKQMELEISIQVNLCMAGEVMKTISCFSHKGPGNAVREKCSMDGMNVLPVIEECRNISCDTKPFVFNGEECVYCPVGYFGPECRGLSY